MEATITVAGDVSTFDASTFKANLATLAKVNVKEVVIEIAPASVAVAVQISAGSSAAATAATAALHASVASLSELLDVEVQQVSGITVEARLVPENFPPLALAQAGAAPPPSSSPWAALFGSFLAVVLGLVLACYWWRRRQRARGRLIDLSAERDANMLQLECKGERGTGNENVIASKKI